MTIERPRAPAQILLVNPATTPAPHRAFEPNIYPHLGLLTLATSLAQALRQSGSTAEVLYYDGSLLGDDFITRYIAENADRIAVIGYSAYTLNYGSCVQLARHAKACNPAIVNIIGNDHFSALYREVMQRQAGTFDYGFYGNDVVESFTQFVVDRLSGHERPLTNYAGLVFRDPRSNETRRNPENPAEYGRLPLPDYSLMDSLVPHAEGYHREQRTFYGYVAEEGLRITIVDIARGCLKFAGRRNESGVPLNACDFCGIVPGSSAMIASSAERAWAVIHNAFSHGYNYLFVTADELPLTFWPLLQAMAERMPDWYVRLPRPERPRLMCYARSDAFRETMRERIDLLMDRLGCDHFFVGLDGFSSGSLRALNKGINRGANSDGDLMQHNLAACREISRRRGRLSSGIVVTHLGITPEILEANYQMMSTIVRQYPRLFIELDFELMCPIPGSLAFDYLRRPGAARTRADALGLNVNDAYLEVLYDKYRDRDDVDAHELADDFILGCCPDITLEMAHDYLRKIRALAASSGISYDSANIAPG